MLKTQIMEDYKQAMREKDALRKGVLVIVKAGLENAEKEKKEVLTPLEETAIIQREIKQTNQTLEEGKKANRSDIVEKEELKLVILSAYLPKQLSVEEATEILIQEGVISGMPMGDAMKIAKAKLNGQIDNKQLSQIVQSIIKG